MWQREDTESERGREILFSCEVLKPPCRQYFLHPDSFAIVPPPLMAMTHNKTFSFAHTFTYAELNHTGSPHIMLILLVCPCMFLPASVPFCPGEGLAFRTSSRGGISCWSRTDDKSTPFCEVTVETVDLNSGCLLTRSLSSERKEIQNTGCTFKRILTELLDQSYYSPS